MSKSPAKLEDAPLSVTCYCDTLIFSHLFSTLLPHVLWLLSASHWNNSQVFMTSLSCSAISSVPNISGNPGSWKYCCTSKTHKGTCSCSSPVSPFLPCSAPCSEHPVQDDVLLCSVVLLLIGLLFFQALKKIVRKKKFCFYSFPKNLFLLSVPCYARPLLSNWKFWRWLYVSSVQV